MEAQRVFSEVGVLYLTLCFKELPEIHQATEIGYGFADVIA
jgi:hypothetical protein